MIVTGAMAGTPFERLIASCADDWAQYTQHAFVCQLGQGTLSASAFRHYLQQDYLFLIHFARAWGLAVYKSRGIAELREALGSLKTIVDVELGLHEAYCAEWGISEHDLASLEEARPTIAYTRYVLDTGNRGDLVDLHVALAPCLIGYGVIANWLADQPWTRLDDNAYAPWIAMYASAEFQQAMQAEINWLNRHLTEVSPARFAELSRVFREATRLEADFWQMGLDLIV